MIVVTGAAGFIGSNILADLEEHEVGPLIAVDWLGVTEKWRNLAKRRLAAILVPEQLPAFLEENAHDIRAVVHMGAISATTELDVDRLVERNVHATVSLWDWCTKHEKSFIYASSAATYGALETGFDDTDNPQVLAALRPLNAYGWSKKVTDDILLSRATLGKPTPPQWVGLKFFNVYGPNEYHKDDQRSVAHKLFEQISASQPIKLFKSYRPDIADGEQRRDFVYVKDCTLIIRWLLQRPNISGIFNLGSGKARSFLDIARGLASTMSVEPRVEFIEMPEQLRPRYQYFTEADVSKLRSKGYNASFHSLEEGIVDYVSSYLAQPDRYR